MDINPARLRDGLRHSFLTFTTRTLPALFLASLLFFGGIILLALRIPGWSLLLGLPATQLGIIFLIFTFDEVSRAKFGPNNSLHIIPCSVCGRPTIAPIDQREDICKDCQKDIKEKLKKKKG